MQALLLVGLLTAAISTSVASAEPRVVLPLDRTAYFVGERVLLAFGTEPDLKTVTLEARGRDGTVRLYEGPPKPLLVDTSRLAPGDYELLVNGRTVCERLTLTDPLRRSAGSLQDEALPNEDLPSEVRREIGDNPALYEQKLREYRDRLVRTLRETGLTVSVAMGAVEMPRRPILDTFARAGAMVLANPDTRPTSFNPVGNDPRELDGMSQRMLLMAQANGRYPNFGGFCFGWDTTGYDLGSRKQLLVYWGWGDQAGALRNYIDRQDAVKIERFVKQTGMQPVTSREYIGYLLAIGRPEFAPMIDLPTKRWLEETALAMKPLPDARRADLQRRLDAWSEYKMGLYRHAYSAFQENLDGLDPALRHTASVQIDHAPTLHGQYFPWAYQPLDFQYQSTWNDQVGGPDYAYQWLFTAALLNMERGERPTWISNALAAAHHRSDAPGKFVRSIAHNLAHGGSGAGFALEGFSNILGGMNRATRWENLKETPLAEDLLAGREFLDRFAFLALEGRGEHGAAILFSRSQFARQLLPQGFGTPQYKALIALTRLGYTPRFISEDEIAAGGLSEVQALVVVAQTFPLPAGVQAAIGKFAAAGGRVIVDGSSTVELPGAAKMGLAFPFSQPGKPHNWSVPNIVAGDNDALMVARWHEELAGGFDGALGETGRGWLRSEQGRATKTTLMQIDGGPDAAYVVAVNDSHVRTQADWHQVTEKLTVAAADEPFLYDANEERALGQVPSVTCDLSQTTARVYALLPRPIERPALAATQRVRAGEELVVRVGFEDPGGKPLEATLPFVLSLVRPDGRPHRQLYRATGRDGRFGISLPVPANAPPGRWRVEVRSQLTGDVASLPVEVSAPAPQDFATPLNDSVVVRQRAAIRRLLEARPRMILPVFDSPRADELAAVAEKVKQTLAARGIAVDIRRSPELATYWLAYDPSPEQRQENERVERGAAMGKIKRTTVNKNDWYCGMGGYRCGRPLILLDLVGEKDNEVAEQLDRLGVLWPQVSNAFPGPGRATVQLVHWAVGPRVDAVVIQAADVAGMSAATDSLANLPADRLSASVRQARDALWRQFHIGGTPPDPPGKELSSAGLEIRHAPRPFAIRFRGPRPPRAGAAARPQRAPHPAHPVPGVIRPRQYVPFVRQAGLADTIAADEFYESSTASMLLRDLRFTDALLIVVDAKQPGKMPVAADGQFRYSDGRPRSQPQWEDVLAVYNAVVRRTRRPMSIEVRRDGKTIGWLKPGRSETRDVPLSTRPSHGSGKEKEETVREEVVIELAGEIELTAGRNELLLVHHNIVDGVAERLRFGVTAAEADAADNEPATSR